MSFLTEGLLPGTEPMTAWTDAVLTVWTAFLAARLFARARGERAVTLWAWGFVAAAASSFVGVVYHGFRIHFPPLGVAISWKLVPVTTGIAALCLGLAAARAWLRPSTRRIVNALLWIELVVCIAAAIASNEFRVAAIDYLIVLLAIGAGALRRLDQREGKWLAAGVAVSVIAAAVQVTETLQIGSFDSNDIFHIIQMIAMFLLFRGGAELRDDQKRNGIAAESWRTRQWSGSS